MLKQINNLNCNVEMNFSRTPTIASLVCMSKFVCVCVYVSVCNVLLSFSYLAHGFLPH